jgi:alpha-glucosidase (family GH31 glycosyl hydrolase)
MKLRLQISNFKLKIILFLILMSPLRGFLSAQTREYKSHTFQDNILNVQCNDGEYRVRPFSAQIMEITFIPTGEKSVDTSHAVVMQPKNLRKSIPIKSPKDSIQFYFSAIDVSKGKYVLNLPSIISKKNPFYLNFDNIRPYELKVKSFTKTSSGFFKNDSLRGFKFNLEKDESIYGLGERALPLDRRGFRLPLNNQPHYGYETESQAMNFNVPFILSSKGYAIFFDNPSKGFVDVGKTDQDVLSFEFIGGRMTYYLIVGTDFEDILNQYTQLTGRQPMPPRWVLGNFASRYGYRTETETRNVIQKFKEQKMPVDGVVIDHYWYGEGEVKKSVAMGDLDWYRPAFPTGEKMMQDFNNQSVKTVLISQPFVLTNSKNYQETVQKGLLATDSEGKPFTIKDFWFGETGLLDIFKPQTQTWLWDKYKTLIKQGMGGVWGDLGEPEKHPAEIRHVAGKADDVRNIYGHYWAKTVYEGYARDFPNIRPFILMRAGFAGSQRFGMIPWSGDVSRSWGGMKAQPSLALNMSMSGLVYMHGDAGGFAGGELNPDLYIRWLQMAVFQPIFRPHGQEQVPSEPVFYADSTRFNAQSLINLRYRMLPYNYTLAWQNSTTGKPLMRPLFFEEPDNQALKNLADTYLWGDNVLVAPVFEANAKTRKIYLPKNNNWYDDETGILHQGGQWIGKSTNWHNIPAMLRGGAFIPFLETVPQNMSEYSSEKLNILYVFDNERVTSRYKMYEDDGESKDAYSKGEYEILEFVSRQDKGNHRFSFIRIKNKPYKGMPASRQIKLTIYNLKTMPTTVLVNKKPISDFKKLDRGDHFYLEINFEWTKDRTVVELR